MVKKSRFTVELFITSCRYIIQKQKDPSKAHQVKLDVIVKALRWLEIDMDVDEVISLYTTVLSFLESSNSVVPVGKALDCVTELA